MYSPYEFNLAQLVASLFDQYIDERTKANGFLADGDGVPGWQ